MLNGWKTYFSALGLAAFALYNLSVGDYAGAWTHFMAALAVFGIRNAMARSGM